MSKFVTIIRNSMVGTVAIVALASAPAIAAPKGDTQSVEVSYSDINLASASGQAQLQNRVRRAVAKVCGYESSSRDLASTSSMRTCMKQSSSNANVEIAALVNGSRLGTERVAMATPTLKFSAHSGN